MTFMLSHEYTPKTIFFYRFRRSELLDKVTRANTHDVTVQCPEHGEHYINELYGWDI